MDFLEKTRGQAAHWMDRFWAKVLFSESFLLGILFFIDKALIESS